MLSSFSGTFSFGRSKKVETTPPIEFTFEGDLQLLDGAAVDLATLSGTEDLMAEPV